MTGFGRGKYESEGREYVVEIKAVNHKYSDVSIRMPRQISYLEDKVRKEVLCNVFRGKIDVFISMIDYSEKGKAIKINKELAKVYISELRELAEETGIEQNINVIDISKFPEVLNISNEDNEEVYWTELSIALKEAISNFNQMRECEGNKISEDLLMRIDRIKEKVSNIIEFSAGLVEEYVVKLQERIKEILKTDAVDETRLAQETVIYADKCSIEEEITRLKSHIGQFEKLLEAEEPCGKKLDFLVQEMNRETNTIGSKSGKLEITNLVIDLKTQIEDIREQIQNIE